ncbi:MAG: MFS transporter [Phycisphaerales bacterium]|nr:MFS transporter [Phycisphaerales bacterium]MCI0675118.1 MFS transporter [Phycisphaerales bacterium]
MGRDKSRSWRDPKMIALIGLGFASGVPLLLTGRTLKVWARREEVDLASIGLLSLVALPYAYKFLWAPLLDRFRLPLLGRRRGWILVLQALLLAAIAGLAFTGPDATATSESLRAFATCAVAVAFLSASHDIVVDAYRTDVLEPAERGNGASLFTCGYRVGMLVSGAGVIYLASHMSWSGAYLLVGATMLAGVGSVLIAPEPSMKDSPPRTFAEAVIDPVGEFMRRNGWRAVLIVAFIFAFKLPDYLASAMTDVLLVDLGYSNKAISLWSLGLGTAVTIPGALVGGPIVSRLGLTRALLLFGAAQAISNAGYLGLALAGEPNEIAMVAVVSIEYFCMGLVAAGFIAFLMSQCQQRYSATQYALLSSLMGLSSSLAGVPAGFAVESFGYPWFLLLTIVAAIPGLAMLPWLPKQAINHPGH